MRARPGPKGRARATLFLRKTVCPNVALGPSSDLATAAPL